MAPLIIERILQPILAYVREWWEVWHSQNVTTTDNYVEVNDTFITIPTTKGVFIFNHGSNAAKIKDVNGAEFVLDSGAGIDFPMKYFKFSAKSNVGGSATELYINYRR